MKFSENSDTRYQSKLYPMLFSSIHTLFGYRDYFDDEQVANIDELVNTRLSEVFDYATEELPPPGTATVGKAAAGG